VLGDRRRATHQNARNDRASRAAWTRNAGPGFELPSTPDQTLSLSELRGHPVILVFYPEDWSPVCSDQLALYQQLLPEFQRFGAALVGGSVDGIWCHLAFAQDRNFHFPLLADFELKGEVSRRYGVYRADDDTSERALYLIDADGIVRWSYASPVGVNPRATGSFTPSRARGISRTEWEARLTEPVDEERLPDASLLGWCRSGHRL
jgi:peroxiredoxin